MPSQRLLDQLNHQGEVNRLMAELGFTDAPVLSEDELRLHTLAVDAGVSPADFVAHILRDRRVAGWAA